MATGVHIQEPVLDTLRREDENDMDQAINITLSKIPVVGHIGDIHTPIEPPDTLETDFEVKDSVKGNEGSASAIESEKFLMSPSVAEVHFEENNLAPDTCQVTEKAGKMATEHETDALHVGESKLDAEESNGLEKGLVSSLEVPATSEVGHDESILVHEARLSENKEDSESTIPEKEAAHMESLKVNPEDTKTCVTVNDTETTSSVEEKSVTSSTSQDIPGEKNEQTTFDTNKETPENISTIVPNDETEQNLSIELDDSQMKTDEKLEKEDEKPESTLIPERKIENDEWTRNQLFETKNETETVIQKREEVIKNGVESSPVAASEAENIEASTSENDTKASALENQTPTENPQEIEVDKSECKPENETPEEHVITETTRDASHDEPTPVDKAKTENEQPNKSDFIETKEDTESTILAEESILEKHLQSLNAIHDDIKACDLVQDTETKSSINEKLPTATPPEIWGDKIEQTSFDTKEETPEDNLTNVSNEETEQNSIVEVPFVTEALTTDNGLAITEGKIKDEDQREKDLLENNNDTESELLKQKVTEKPVESLQLANAAEDTQVSTLDHDTEISSLKNQILTENPQDILADETESKPCDVVDTKKGTLDVQDVSTIESNVENENLVIKEDESKKPLSREESTRDAARDESKYTHEDKNEGDDQRRAELIKNPNSAESLSLIEDNTIPKLLESPQVDAEDIKTRVLDQDAETTGLISASGGKSNDGESAVKYEVVKTEDDDQKEDQWCANEKNPLEAAQIETPIESWQESLPSTVLQGFPDDKTDERTVDAIQKDKEILDNISTIVPNEEAEQNLSVELDDSHTKTDENLEKEDEKPESTLIPEGKIKNEESTQNELFETKNETETVIQKSEEVIEKSVEYSPVAASEAEDIETSTSDRDAETSALENQIPTENPQETEVDKSECKPEKEIPEEQVSTSTWMISEDASLTKHTAHLEKESEKPCSTDASTRDASNDETTPVDEAMKEDEEPSKSDLFENKENTESMILVEEPILEKHLESSNAVHDDNKACHLVQDTETKSSIKEKLPTATPREIWGDKIEQTLFDTKEETPEDISTNVSNEETEQNSIVEVPFVLLENNNDTESELLKQEVTEKPVESLQLANEAEDTKVSTSDHDTTISVLENQILTENPQEIVADETERKPCAVVDTNKETLDRQDVSTIESNDDNEENLVIEEDESEKSLLREESTRGAAGDESTYTYEDKNEGEDQRRVELLENANSAESLSLIEDDTIPKLVESPQVDADAIKTHVLDQDAETTSLISASEGKSNDGESAVKYEVVKTEDDDQKEDQLCDNEKNPLEAARIETPIESFQETLPSTVPQGFPDDETEEKTVDSIHTDREILDIQNITKTVLNENIEDNSLIQIDGSPIQHEESLEKEHEIPSLIEAIDHDSLLLVEGSQIQCKEYSEEENEITSIIEASTKNINDENSVSVHEDSSELEDLRTYEFGDTEITSQEEEAQVETPANSSNIDAEDIIALDLCQETETTSSQEERTLNEEETVCEQIEVGTADTKTQTSEAQDVSRIVPNDDSGENSATEENDLQTKKEETFGKETKKPHVTETSTTDASDDDSANKCEDKVEGEEQTGAELFEDKKDMESKLLKEEEITVRLVESPQVDNENIKTTGMIEASEGDGDNDESAVKNEVKTEDNDNKEDELSDNEKNTESGEPLEAAQTEKPIESLQETLPSTVPQGFLDDNTEEKTVDALLKDEDVQNVTTTVPNEKIVENSLIQMDCSQIQHEEYLEKEHEIPSVIEASTKHANDDELIVHEDTIEHEDPRKVEPESEKDIEINLKEEDAQIENHIKSSQVAAEDIIAPYSYQGTETTYSQEEQILYENEIVHEETEMERLDAADTKETPEAPNFAIILSSENLQENSRIPEDGSEQKHEELLEKESKASPFSKTSTMEVNDEVPEVIHQDKIEDEKLEKFDKFECDKHEEITLSNEAPAEKLNADPQEITGDQTDDKINTAATREKTLEALNLTKLDSNEIEVLDSVTPRDGLKIEDEEISMLADNEESIIVREDTIEGEDLKKVETFESAQQTEDTLLKEEAHEDESMDSLHVASEPIKVFISSQDKDPTSSFEEQILTTTPQIVGDQVEEKLTDTAKTWEEMPEVSSSVIAFQEDEANRIGVDGMNSVMMKDEETVNRSNTAENDEICSSDKLQANEEEMEIISKTKIDEEADKDVSWIKLIDDETDKTSIEVKEIDFSSHDKDTSEITQHDGAKDIPKGNENSTAKNEFLEDGCFNGSTESTTPIVNENDEKIHKDIKAETDITETGAASSALPITGVQCGPEETESEDSKAKETETSLALESREYQVQHTKLHEFPSPPLSHVKDSEWEMAQERDRDNLQSGDDTKELDEGSAAISNEGNFLEANLNKNIETEVTEGEKEAPAIQWDPVSEFVVQEIQEPGKTVEAVAEEKGIKSERGEIKFDDSDDLKINSSTVVTEKVAPSDILCSSTSDAGQSAVGQETQIVVQEKEQKPGKGKAIEAVPEEKGINTEEDEINEHDFNVLKENSRTVALDKVTPVNILQGSITDAALRTTDEETPEQYGLDEASLKEIEGGLASTADKLTVLRADQFDNENFDSSLGSNKITESVKDALGDTKVFLSCEEKEITSSIEEQSQKDDQKEIVVDQTQENILDSATEAQDFKQTVSHENAGENLLIQVDESEVKHESLSDQTQENALDTAPKDQDLKPAISHENAEEKSLIQVDEIHMKHDELEKESETPSLLIVDTNIEESKTIYEDTTEDENPKKIHDFECEKHEEITSTEEETQVTKVDEFFKEDLEDIKALVSGEDSETTNFEEKQSLKENPREILSDQQEEKSLDIAPEAQVTSYHKTSEDSTVIHENKIENENTREVDVFECEKHVDGKILDAAPEAPESKIIVWDENAEEKSSDQVDKSQTKHDELLGNESKTLFLSEASLLNTSNEDSTIINDDEIEDEDPKKVDELEYEKHTELSLTKEEEPGQILNNPLKEDIEKIKEFVSCLDTETSSTEDRSQQINPQVMGKQVEENIIDTTPEPQNFTTLVSDKNTKENLSLEDDELQIKHEELSENESEKPSLSILKTSNEESSFICHSKTENEDVKRHEKVEQLKYFPEEGPEIVEVPAPSENLETTSPVEERSLTENPQENLTKDKILDVVPEALESKTIVSDKNIEENSFILEDGSQMKYEEHSEKKSEKPSVSENSILNARNEEPTLFLDGKIEEKDQAKGNKSECEKHAEITEASVENPNSSNLENIEAIVSCDVIEPTNSTEEQSQTVNPIEIVGGREVEKVVGPDFTPVVPDDSNDDNPSIHVDGSQMKHEEPLEKESEIPSSLETALLNTNNEDMENIHKDLTEDETIENIGEFESKKCSEINKLKEEAQVEDSTVYKDMKAYVSHQDTEASALQKQILAANPQDILGNQSEDNVIDTADSKEKITEQNLPVSNENVVKDSLIQIDESETKYEEMLEKEPYLEKTSTVEANNESTTNHEDVIEEESGEIIESALLNEGSPAYESVESLQVFSEDIKASVSSQKTDIKSSNLNADPQEITGDQIDDKINTAATREITLEALNLTTLDSNENKVLDSVNPHDGLKIEDEEISMLADNEESIIVREDTIEGENLKKVDTFESAQQTEDTLLKEEAHEDEFMDSLHVASEPIKASVSCQDRHPTSYFEEQILTTTPQIVGDQVEEKLNDTAKTLEETPEVSSSVLGFQEDEADRIGVDGMNSVMIKDEETVNRSNADENDEICCSDKVQAKEEEMEMISKAKIDEEADKDDTWIKLTDDETDKTSIGEKEIDFSSHDKDTSEITQHDGAEDIPKGNENSTAKNVFLEDGYSNGSTESTTPIVNEDAEKIDKEIKAEIDITETGAASSALPITGVQCGPEETESENSKAKETETSAPEGREYQVQHTKLHESPSPPLSHVKDSEWEMAQERGRDNLQSGDDTEELDEGSAAIYNEGNFLEANLNKNIETEVTEGEKESSAIQQDPVLEFVMQEIQDQPGKTVEAVAEEKRMKSEHGEIKFDDSDDLKINSSTMVTDKVAPSDILCSSTSDAGQRDVGQETQIAVQEKELKPGKGKAVEAVPVQKGINTEEDEIKEHDFNVLKENSRTVALDKVTPVNILQGSTTDAALRATDEETPEQYGLDEASLKEIEGGLASTADKLTVLRADQIDNENFNSSLGSNKIPVLQHGGSSESSQTEGEKQNTSEPEKGEKQKTSEPEKGEKCRNEETAKLLETSESIEMDKPSLSGLLQEPMKEVLKVVDHSIDKKEQTTKEEELQAEKSAEAEHVEAKTDKEKDGEEESVEHQISDLSSEAPVMVDAADKDVKVAYKKSHNILSGVGSKVKHSISKVKKAITGKSSHPKSASPKYSDKI